MFILLYTPGYDLTKNSFFRFVYNLCLLSKCWKGSYKHPTSVPSKNIKTKRKKGSELYSNLGLFGLRSDIDFHHGTQCTCGGEASSQIVNQIIKHSYDSSVVSKNVINHFFRWLLDALKQKKNKCKLEYKNIKRFWIKLIINKQFPSFGAKICLLAKVWRKLTPGALLTFLLTYSLHNRLLESPWYIVYVILQSWLHWFGQVYFVKP